MSKLHTTWGPRLRREDTKRRVKIYNVPPQLFLRVVHSCGYIWANLLHSPSLYKYRGRMKSGYHFTTGNELGLGLWVIGVVISGYLIKPQIVYSQTRTNVGYVFVAWRSFCLCVADWSVESSTNVLEQVVFTLLSSISCCEPALLAAASCFCCYVVCLHMT